MGRARAGADMSGEQAVILRMVSLPHSSFVLAGLKALVALFVDHRIGQQIAWDVLHRRVDGERVCGPREANSMGLWAAVSPSLYRSMPVDCIV
jgi:hypothetical protein